MKKRIIKYVIIFITALALLSFALFIYNSNRSYEDKSVRTETGAIEVATKYANDRYGKILEDLTDHVVDVEYNAGIWLVTFGSVQELGVSDDGHVYVHVRADDGEVVWSEYFYGI